MKASFMPLTNYLLVAFMCAASAFAADTTGSVTLEDGEVPPEVSIECFRGAYYRKAVSSFDKWTGIEATVTLPAPKYDATRRNPKTGRFLDNASVYVGGRADEQEIDCGLSWEVIREVDGSVSREGKAFRPFWRGKTWNSGPARPEYYYLPGDTVRMSCATTETGRLTFAVELLSRGDLGTTMPQESVFITTFEAESFGPRIAQQFKRVNAIDQSGNEGKEVQPTNAVVEGAKWRNVVLVRGDRKLPMIPLRFTDMRCPDAANIRVEAMAADPSGEVVTIVGASGK